MIKLVSKGIYEQLVEYNRIQNQLRISTNNSYLSNMVREKSLFLLLLLFKTF